MALGKQLQLSELEMPRFMFQGLHQFSGVFFSKFLSVHSLLGGGFKHFFIFTPTWGNDPIWLIV